jgi:ornithine carbamoyltransferase
MTSCIVARVGPHSDVADLAKYSTVPVINALSSDYHPLQSIADFLTIYESHISSPSRSRHSSPAPGLGLEGLKVAWIGDSTNVLFDLAIGAMKLGVNISVASPQGYKIPAPVLEVIRASTKGVTSPGELIETKTPEEAVQNADIIATDSWISMGQEAETARRLKAFEGYKVTSELARRGGAKDDWKFMHCLPRHSEEVSDDVFYSPRSLVFKEAENRLWAAVCKISPS